MSHDDDRTASLMTPARLAQLKVRPAPAASPNAWLDQMAADAGSGHIRRLMDLRRQLVAQLENPPHAAAARTAQQLAGALGEVDFSLLQPRGWLARATGKGKEAAGAFRAQCDRGTHAAQAVATELRALQRRHEAQAVAVQRIATDGELELRAIAKIMEQGTRWLQDMRNQLKAREAAGGDEAARAKIVEDTHRCELLVARLKLLRAADGAGAQALEHCKALMPRAAAVLASLQQLLEGDWKDASRRLDALCEQGDATAAAEDVDAARKALPRVAEALKQAAADCEALQAQEQALAGELGTLQEPLQAAA